MRLWNVMIVSVVAFLLTITVVAQQNNSGAPAAPDQDRVEKAHADLLKPSGDKAAEAGRLTEALSSAFPPLAASHTPLPRKNYVDEHIFGRMERDGIPHAPLAGDEEFIRRAYLDATGLLPEPDKVRAFLASDDPQKRDTLVDALIGSEEFTEQWAWLWADLFQTGRPPFTYWLKQWLKLDRPYDQVAKEILGSGVMKTPSSNPTWAVTAEPIHVNSRDLVSTDQDNYFVLNRLDFFDGMAVSFGRVFLGLNMDCFSCHDGARHLESLNLYLAGKKRSEFHQQAAFWGRLNMVPSGMTAGNAVLNDLNPGYTTGNDAPYVTGAESRFPRNGQTYEPAFILTGEKPPPGTDPRKELGRMVTSHIQFSRAAVNIVWGRLMTVGFVEPYDGFDLLRLDPNNPPTPPWTLQPTNPWLLEAMAKDFTGHNYSMHRLIKTIMKSNAYQLSAQFPERWTDRYAPYYARHYARVLTGPEVVDVLAQVTSLPYQFDLSGQKVQRVKQLSSPNNVNPPEANKGGVNDLGNEGTVQGNALKAIMQSFFQSTRETPALLTNRPSAVQAMLLMTSPVVSDKVVAKPDSRVRRLLDSGKTDGQIVEELFLAALSRSPRPAETQVALRILREGDRRQRAEDLQWALVNSVEFLLNH